MQTAIIHAGQGCSRRGRSRSAIALVVLASIAVTACESARPSRTEEQGAGGTAASPPAPGASTASAPPAEPAQPSPPAPAPPADSPSATPAPPPTRKLRIKTDFANFREGPGTGARVLGVLKKGARLEALDERDRWFRVRLADGREGWVAESVTAEAPD
jgi:uncharacterized protein YgiM (DUF1202 family)